VSEIVDQLVIGLGERIDHLQDSETEQDFDRIAVLASTLVENARQAGFAELAQIASALETVSTWRDAEGTHARLVELTEIVHRVRLGHMGTG
jgi:HPt (histidine-containing phosphotransfer) domain-containing protein